MAQRVQGEGAEIGVAQRMWLVWSGAVHFGVADIGGVGGGGLVVLVG